MARRPKRNYRAYKKAMKKMGIDRPKDEHALTKI